MARKKVGVGLARVVKECVCPHYSLFSNAVVKVKCDNLIKI